jgi:hypothetical protein
MNILKIFEKNGFSPKGGKTLYKKLYPDHVVISDASVVGEKSGTLWSGDIDLTTDYDSLSKISEELNESLYVLHNGDLSSSLERIKEMSIAKITSKTLK